MAESYHISDNLLFDEKVNNLFLLQKNLQHP
jgi:hypothetical protein